MDRVNRLKETLKLNEDPVLREELVREYERKGEYGKALSSYVTSEGQRKYLKRLIYDLGVEIIWTTQKRLKNSITSPKDLMGALTSSKEENDPKLPDRLDLHIWGEGKDEYEEDEKIDVLKVNGEILCLEKFTWDSFTRKMLDMAVERINEVDLRERALIEVEKYKKGEKYRDLRFKEVTDDENKDPVRAKLINAIFEVFGRCPLYLAPEQVENYERAIVYGFWTEEEIVELILQVYLP